MKFLDNLSRSLAFPDSFLDAEKFKLPLNHHYLREESPRCYNSDTILKIASFLCSHYEPNKEIEDSILRAVIVGTTNKSNYLMRMFQAGHSPEVYPTYYQDLLWIKSDLYNFISILNNGIPIHELFSKAKEGHLKSICKLVQIDKTVITESWLEKIIVQKQYKADWEFFKLFGNYLSKPPLEKQQYLFRIIVITAKYWEEYFQNISYSKLVAFYIKQEILPPSTNVENFRKTLNRVGLKKKRYNKK